MSDHQAAIDAIERADSHAEIRNIVRGYSAAALDPNAPSLLYSGAILEAPPEARGPIFGKQVAEAVARPTGANMLDDTPRGKLLLDKEVEKASEERSTCVDRCGRLDPEASLVEAGGDPALASRRVIGRCGDGAI